MMYSSIIIANSAISRAGLTQLLMSIIAKFKQTMSLVMIKLI